MLCCHLAITQVCNHGDSNPDLLRQVSNPSPTKPEVRIQLDSNSVLSAPSGVYATVQFHLSLDPNLNLTKTALISHFEKFPSRGRHATFVTSVRPETAVLGKDMPTTVTVTIFAPNYVPNETRVLITLIVREKPSNPMDISRQNLILGRKTFYFLVTNWLLKDIDHELPDCQNKFLCHNILEACNFKKSKKNVKESSKSTDSCSDHDWTADVLVYDNVTGLKSVQNLQDGNFVDDNLLIGSTRSTKITVSGSCCNAFEAILNLTDVAGNSNLCHASMNASPPVQITANWPILVNFSLLLLTKLLLN